MRMRPHLAGVLALAAAFGLVAAPLAVPQSRIRTMPGFAQWAEMSPRLADAVKSGAITPRWASDSKSFDYMLDGVHWRFDVTSLQATRISDEPGDPPPALSGPAMAPASASTGSLVLARGRGRDADVPSPDGQMRAFSRDQNMWLAQAGDGAEIQLTTDGGGATRLRHGVGSYVYLEEFSVSQPVWWSPDSSRLAWMRYDESQVKDYFLPVDQSRKLPTILAEAYPHPGEANPVADLLVRDMATGFVRTMDVREGQSITDDVVGHYVWAAQWMKDGSEILVRRADRRQKTIDLAACSPVTGVCRSVVRESRPQAWARTEAPRFFDDGKRFIWTSERSDYRNFYLYDVSGRLLAQLTRHAFDVADIVKVDEQSGWLWYTARSGENHMLMQLHRVRLNGRDDVRLTDPKLNHKVEMSPDGQYFVDIEQTHDRAPVSRLRDFNGRLVAEIATSDTSRFDAMGLKPAEMFTFTAADGATQLHAQLQFPSNFDPARKYPMLVSVYGGPSSTGLSETFPAPNPLAEYGFLMLKVDARTNAGLGRKVLDQAYQQLGVVEVDDIAVGIKAAATRPYVDATRVGIYGTSYGGSVSALVLMRHPDVVQAAVANSPVADYRLYDSVYSERHLGLPETDPGAYDRAALLTYANRLTGSLMLYYGTSDDNVHPNNSLQLIRALQAAGKSFELQVGPDRGHTSVDPSRMMEFFIERLILDRRDDRPLPATGSGN